MWFNKGVQHESDPLAAWPKIITVKGQAEKKKKKKLSG